MIVSHFLFIEVKMSFFPILHRQPFTKTNLRLWCTLGRWTWAWSPLWIYPSFTLLSIKWTSSYLIVEILDEDDKFMFYLWCWFNYQDQSILRFALIITLRSILLPPSTTFELRHPTMLDNPRCVAALRCVTFCFEFWCGFGDFSKLLVTFDVSWLLAC